MNAVPVCPCCYNSDGAGCARCKPERAIPRVQTMRVAEVSYTIETRGGRPVRRTKLVRASAEQLPDAIARVLAKLDERDAYQIETRYSSHDEVWA